MTESPCQVLVLISGNGSNLQALIDHSPSAAYRIAAVISNNPDAFGLQRAARAEIPTLVIDHREFPSRESFDMALQQAIDEIKPDLIVLAGFMRILGAAFVTRYAGKMLNIHPSLLPKYRGTKTHQRALDAGDKEHGVSVHFVTEDLDGGPIVAHDKVRVRDGDTADSLQARVLKRENRLYPRVVDWFAQGRLRMQGDQALLDDETLPPTGLEIRP